MDDPLFTFGIIADIQYADMDDGYNYTKTRVRFYRNSLSLLQGAVREWASEEVTPQFILQLGDLIDGYNVLHKSSEASLKKVLTEIDKLKTPVHHIWGNHEFYNFSRKQLMESRLNSSRVQATLTTVPEDGSDPLDWFYTYHFSPSSKFRLLLIDSYDFSVIGRDPSSEKHIKSSKLLRQKNPNEDKNSPKDLAETRFVQFNGGISAAQLSWIKDVLETADKNKEKVIVAGHLPVHPSSTDPICLTWNYQEVLDLLQSHPCVVAYFSGHDHDGGYHQDECGIHHLTFNGIIETPPESQAFGTMYVYQDKMVLKGRGLVPDRTLLYRQKQRMAGKSCRQSAGKTEK
ncbi:manganese-dependent ADP-ribose/CDP-alcohol diphosphatase-like [Bufo gargarizans]|uniref:manganese-dependent ADP-ribose/CDP-alcohol diphosphatase-like n=1 Tax=Bufo gargarizans TaxID=30331 RepID=UPI001CF28235|nr:manganese-dependent ADP-ribose/CDP-alcohol diphosphatase-like [Bufo gargarizans]